MDLARIDEDISQQKARIRNLYSQRNSRVPISRLPTEILEFIFIRLACHRFYRHSTHRAPDWFHVSHVSSRWRNVALNCPLLWSHITAGSQRWVDVLLERSTQAPLKIRVDLKYSEDSRKLSPFIEKILQHAERIEELSFCSLVWDKQTVNCFHTLYSSISHLRVLDFSVELISWGPSEDCGERILSPHHFFNLGSLTTLRLQFISTRPRFQYDVPGFLSVLSCMPDLANLYLEYALASADDFISSAKFDALQKIDLPCLSRLMVNAPLSTIIALFSSINIPVRTQIRLDSYSHEYSREKPESLDNCEQFCSVLARHYSNDQVPSLPKLHFVAMNLDPDETSLMFSMSPNCEFPSGSLSPDNWPSYILLEIHISPPNSSDTGLLGSNLCAFMPTTNVQTLHIAGPPARQAFWRDTFRHFPGLRCMEISGGTMGDDLVSSLFPHITDKFVETQGGSVRAPVLKELTLDKMELQMLGDRHKVSRRLPIDQTSLKLPPYQGLESLCSALPSCAGSKGRLTITKCYVCEDEDSYDMVGKWDSGRFHVLRERFWSSKEWDSDSSSSSSSSSSD